MVAEGGVDDGIDGDAGGTDGDANCGFGSGGGKLC
jgi:hypothetical protein